MLSSYSSLSKNCYRNTLQNDSAKLSTLRALVPCVTHALCALVIRVFLALFAVVPHVLHSPLALVPRLSRVLRALVPHVSHALLALMFYVPHTLYALLLTTDMLPLLKEYQIAHLNLNNCNRPSAIVNSQNHLITHKGPTAVVNGRPYIYIKKKETCTWKTNLRWISQKDM